MSKELSGKTAFVTGSGRGLGRIMAERLAELGADVAIHDISWTAPAKYGESPDLGAVAKEIERHGGRVATVSGNIGDKDAVATMKKEIDAKLGHVHILVNCAGGDIGAAGGKPNPNNALDVSFEDIKALTENNLIGTMLVCQAFVPPMVKAGGGSVINIASAAAHMGVSPEVVYSTLKAAVCYRGTGCHRAFRHQALSIPITKAPLNSEVDNRGFRRKPKTGKSPGRCRNSDVSLAVRD